MNKETTEKLHSPQSISKYKYRAVCESFPLTADIIKDISIEERIKQAILENDDILFTAPAHSEELVEAYKAAASLTGFTGNIRLHSNKSQKAGDIVMLKLCRCCGAPFITRKIRSVYCSLECKIEYNNALLITAYNLKLNQLPGAKLKETENPNKISLGHNTYWDDGYNGITKTHFLLTLKEARNLNEDFEWAVLTFAKERDSQAEFTYAGIKKWIEDKKLPQWALDMGMEWYIRKEL